MDEHWLFLAESSSFWECEKMSVSRSLQINRESKRGAYETRERIKSAFIKFHADLRHLILLLRFIFVRLKFRHISLSIYLLPITYSPSLIRSKSDLRDAKLNLLCLLITFDISDKNFLYNFNIQVQMICKSLID